MSTIGDAIDKNETEFTDFEQAAAEAQAAEAEIVEQPRRFALPAWVKAETGEGDIEDYINHPLNFNHSRGFAQIIRGLTGIFGSLRYALLDIGLGLLQVSKERKAKIRAAQEVVSHAVDAAGH